VNFSRYQRAIFDWVRSEAGHAIVEAVAGSGKTTTIVEALRFIDPGARVLFCAFNRHIAEELKRRVPPNVQVATLNGFGWGICRRAVPAVQLDDRKTEAILRHKVYRLGVPVPVPVGAGSEGESQEGPAFAPEAIAEDQAELLESLAALDERERRRRFSLARGVYGSLVGLLKATVSATAEGWPSVADRYGVETGETSIEEIDGLLPLVYGDVIGNQAVMDFDDQVFMPINHGYPVPAYDFVVVDESQDLSPVQIELVIRAAGSRGRVLCVGDSHQAIYGFRGADPWAIATLVERLKAVKLPLSICYRCPQAVVARAREIVPQIEAAPGAAEGAVEWIEAADFPDRIGPGDYALCRITAPLVDRCFEQIRLGRRASVRGRDIGTGLLRLVDRLAAGPDQPTAEFREALDAYRLAELEKLARQQKETQALALADRCDTLAIFAGECRTVGQMRRRIEALFSDTSGPREIVFSTIHKAKGLEAPNVFILRPDLLPHPKCNRGWQRTQEENLKYVAITRATARLTFVREKEVRP
jgi:DNA helicase-2/ATP-dependent DNA helicase PcrA